MMKIMKKVIEVLKSKISDDYHTEIIQDRGTITTDVRLIETMAVKEPVGSTVGTIEDNGVKERAVGTQCAIYSVFIARIMVT
jgi:hypothetical protein